MYRAPPARRAARGTGRRRMHLGVTYLASSSIPTGFVTGPVVIAFLIGCIVGMIVMVKNR
jgi:hypothetical protein